MSQVPIVFINLSINLFRIKEICVITFNSEEELVPPHLGRNIVWCFKLELHENILPSKINNFPREVQLRDVEVIF